MERLFLFYETHFWPRDASVMRGIYSWSKKRWVKALSHTLAFLGGVTGVILFWSVLYVFFKPDIIVALSAIAGTFLFMILKRIFKRQRPFDKIPILPHGKIPDKFSFPSGHTMMATNSAFVTMFLFPFWYVYIISSIWVVLMALSRVVLGMHYPSDTIAGFALGAVVTKGFLSMHS